MLLYRAWNEQYQDTTLVFVIFIIVIIEMFVATYYFGMESVLNL
jgi:type III secretory pathway component EscS